MTAPPAILAAPERPRVLLSARNLWLRWADLIVVVGLTLLAAGLRFWALGDIPQGIHGDEAQVGMDARRVLADGWIGPYTPAALGQPSGHAYLTAPAVELFGSTAFAVRLPFAIVATAAVPLTYVLFRLLANRPVAVIAAFLLAVSLWHLHYSRTAHWPITYPTVALGVLVLWALALRSGRWYWFAAAGALLGLGLYTYNIYPIFVIAFAVWVGVYTLVFKRGAAFLPWARKVALAAVISVVVGLPLFIYMADPANDYFGHYRGYYNLYSVLQSKAFLEADTWGKVEVVTGQVERFVGAYVWRGIPDFIDGASPDRRPMLDSVSVALMAVGAVLALWRWRETPHLMTLLMVAIIPLTTVLQTNAIYRGPLGVAPFLAFLTALPLSLAWRNAVSLEGVWRPVAYGGVAIVMLIIAYTNLNAYFGSWARSDLFPWVYARQISDAAEYAGSQPGQPYVYFYAARWTWNYETRQYLAEDSRGEDRSREFGGGLRFDVDRSREALVILIPPYHEFASYIEGIHPGGRRHVQRDGEETVFIAYHLPALRPQPRQPAGTNAR